MIRRPRRSPLFPYPTLFRPPGSVVVGEATMRAARDVADYEPLEPLELKGKAEPVPAWEATGLIAEDRKSTRLNSSHANISYAVFCLKKKTSVGYHSAGSFVM